MFKLEIQAIEPEAVRDEVDNISLAFKEAKNEIDKCFMFPKPMMKLDQIEIEDKVEPFEIDVTSLAANLGRNVARLIVSGIVQDYYDGDWKRVRIVGLGEESSPLIPLQRGTMEVVV